MESDFRLRWTSLTPLTVFSATLIALTYLSQIANYSVFPYEGYVISVIAAYLL